MLTYIIIYVDFIKALLNAEVVAMMNFLGGGVFKGFSHPWHPEPRLVQTCPVLLLL